MAILPPSLLRRNPLYLSLNTYFEVVSRRDYGSGHGRGRDGTPPLRGSENVPLSRDERAAEVGAGPNGLCVTVELDMDRLKYLELYEQS